MDLYSDKYVTCFFHLLCKHVILSALMHFYLIFQFKVLEIFEMFLIEVTLLNMKVIMSLLGNVLSYIRLLCAHFIPLYSFPI